MEITPTYNQSLLFLAEESKELDIYTEKEFGVPGILLMGNAAMSIFKEYESLLIENDTIFLCGSGNNGGDGIALAYLLAQRQGYVNNCHVFIKDGKHSEVFQYYHGLLQKTNVDIYSIEQFSSVCKEMVNFNGIMIDALLGIGFTPPLSKLFSELIEEINEFKSIYPETIILSIDTISGYSLANLDTYINADYLAEVGVKKLVNEFCRNELQKYSFHSIGFPIIDFVNNRKIHRSAVYTLEGIDIDIIREYSFRDIRSHKYSNGSLGLIGGSVGMAGAIFLAQKAFHRMGGGISKVYTPARETVYNLLDRDESMMIDILQESTYQDSFFQKANAFLIGPGLKPSEFILPVDKLLQLNKPVIIDSGGIDAFKQMELNENFILTPHPGEFKRLIDADHDSIKELLLQIEQYCKICKVNLIYRSSFSILCTARGDMYIWNYPNSKLAVMGSGDLFLGVFSYYIARGYSLDFAFHLTQSLIEQSREMDTHYPTASEIKKFIIKRLYHG